MTRRSTVLFQFDTVTLPIQLFACFTSLYFEMKLKLIEELENLSANLPFCPEKFIFLCSSLAIHINVIFIRSILGF